MSEESQPQQPPISPPRFSFVRELGRGVLGEAHEVIDEVSGEPVVLKVFVRCEPRDPERFRLEFESLSRLQHSSLVDFHRIVDPMSDTNIAVEQKLGRSGFAFTQEYVDGVDLLTYLRTAPTLEELRALESRRTPTTQEISVEITSEVLPPADAEGAARDESSQETPEEVTPSTGGSGLREETASSIIEELANVEEEEIPLDLVMLRLERLVPQIIAGLQHLHRFNHVHGFLRPSNVLVTRDGRVKLSDYGVVAGLVYRPRGSQDGEGVSLLQAPEQIPYVAPEVGDEVTVAGDVYALGCILFEAIAGFPPSEAFEMIGRRAKTLQVPPLAEVVPACPTAWAERIDALLRDDPAQRLSLGMLADIVGGIAGRAVHLPRTVVPKPELFVGQQAAVRHLRDSARRVIDEERMRLILLEGPSGAGKSTIAAEIAHWLSRRGWLVITGECFDRESVPHEGWQDIAERVVTMVEALPEATKEHLEGDRRLAGRLFPKLAPPGAETFDEPISRLAAIRALRRILAALAAERPIFLCLEDLHYASWDTAALLVDLMVEETDIPCLVLGTWRTDSPRSEEWFLFQDVELSLLDVERLRTEGFTKDAAREYLVTRADGASLEDLRTIIRLGRSSPRLLDELVFELERGRLHELRPGRHEDHLAELFEQRIETLEKVQRTMLDLLAVASGPLEEGWLMRAVVAELAGTVLPAEQTPAAIGEAFRHVAAERLVTRDEHDDGEVEWVISHDVCREAVLEGLDERDEARLAGRLADTVGEKGRDHHAIKFEYELRARRVAKAMKAAERAAREAEGRFAYHRAAKLWRWLLDHEDELEDPTLEPLRELARAEHLAGRHGEAAELFRRWAEREDDRFDRARIRREEAMAWLQAGDGTSAVEALERAFGEFGETYQGRWHSPVTEAPRRWFAAASRWNQRLVEQCRSGAAQRPERVRGELYDFALSANDVLWSDRGHEIEARLARLASGTQDARLLGLHRIRLATLHAGSGEADHRDRSMEWLDEAEQMLAKVDDVGSAAELHLRRAILHIRFGELDTARKSFDEVEALNRLAEDVQQNDRRLMLYWKAVFHLYTAQLDEAEHLGRRLLHTYRGDRVAASAAYRILARVALYRGETQRAEAFVAEGSGAVSQSRPNVSRMLWVREETRLHIAMGRPEVAVGKLDVELERLSDESLDDARAFEVPIHLSIGQAVCALAERQRVLGQERPGETRPRLRAARRCLRQHVDDMNDLRRSEALRVLARIHLLQGRFKKALRAADAAVEALGTVGAPVHQGCCLEARGHVLLRLERPEARGILEQAAELYRYLGVNHPLVLEGWPPPRDATMLKEDER